MLQGHAEILNPLLPRLSIYRFLYFSSQNISQYFSSSVDRWQLWLVQTYKIGSRDKPFGPSNLLCHSWSDYNFVVLFLPIPDKLYPFIYEELSVLTILKDFATRQVKWATLRLNKNPLFQIIPQEETSLPHPSCHNHTATCISIKLCHTLDLRYGAESGPAAHWDLADGDHPIH